MESLLLFSIPAVALGAVLACFHRRTFWDLCIKAALANLAFLTAATLILDGPAEHYSLRYLLEGLAYFVYPYVIFLFVPSVSTAGLTLLIRRTLRSRGQTNWKTLSGRDNGSHRCGFLRRSRSGWINGCQLNKPMKTRTITLPFLWGRRGQTRSDTSTASRCQFDCPSELGASELTNFCD